TAVTAVAAHQSHVPDVSQACFTRALSRAQDLSCCRQREVTSRQGTRALQERGSFYILTENFYNSRKQ
ncbi:MAG: hypothetical protein Q6365_016165, partial [Candidatus Sigynarchaeota archaeon]